MVNAVIYSAELTIIVGGIFGILLWIMVFLQTYRHFPKMSKRQRLLMSVGIATLLTFIVLVICFLSMILLTKQLGL